MFQTDGVFVCSKSPPVFSLEQAEMLTALEGLLLSMAIVGKEVTFQNDVESITDTMEKGILEGPGYVVKRYHIALRKNWGYAKVSTRGKSYAAHDGAKMSEMVGKLRTHLMSDLSKGKEASMWSLFSRLCDEEKPVGGGYRFEDFYLGKNWEEKTISRSPNCYTRLSYKYRAQDSDCVEGYDVESQLQRLGTFPDSAFYQNQPWFMCSLASMKLAFEEVRSDRMLFIVGSGGDSKGIVATLERGVMGEEHSATLGPSVFYEDAEFRRSAHFASGKQNILPECRKGSRFAGICGSDLL